MNLQSVHCSRGHTVDRESFQARLSAANPKWHQYARELKRTRAQPKTNPDGDVSTTELYVIKLEHVTNVHELFLTWCLVRLP
jgi:NAD-dependent deacetylase sirtuin 4